MNNENAPNTEEFTSSGAQRNVGSREVVHRGF